MPTQAKKGSTDLTLTWCPQDSDWTNHEYTFLCLCLLSPTSLCLLSLLFCFCPVFALKVLSVSPVSGRFVPDKRGFFYIWSWEDTGKVSRPTVSCFYQPWLYFPPQSKATSWETSNFCRIWRPCCSLPKGLAPDLNHEGAGSLKELRNCVLKEWINGHSQPCCMWGLRLPAPRTPEPYNLVVREPNSIPHMRRYSTGVSRAS